MAEKHASSQKLVIFCAVGGCLVGFHAAFLVMGLYAPWVVFNLVLGALFIWMGSLVGRGYKREDEEKELTR